MGQPKWPPYVMDGRDRQTGQPPNRRDSLNGPLT